MSGLCRQQTLNTLLVCYILAVHRGCPVVGSVEGLWILVCRSRDRQVPVAVTAMFSRPLERHFHLDVGEQWHMESFNPLDSKGNYSATWNNTKLVHWPLMGGLLHLVQRGVD